MQSSHLHLFGRTIWKQEACSYAIVVPVLAYFVLTSFAFAKSDIVLFLTLVVAASTVFFGIGITVEYFAMRPVLRCVKALQRGKTSTGEIENAVRSAYRFPFAHALTVLIRWAVGAPLAILTPFAIRGTISTTEIVGVLFLTFFTAIGSMPFYFLIAENARARFLSLPQVQAVSTAWSRARHTSLSRKVTLVLLAVAAYPTGILTSLIVLSNRGTLDLKGTGLGLVLLVLATAAISVLVSFLISGSVARPLKRAVEVSARIAAGDLGAAATVQSRDEVGMFAVALNTMSERLRGIVIKVQESAHQVASSSQEISTSTRKLSEGAQLQASSLEQTSASVEELSASVGQVADHAQSQAAAVEQGKISMAQVHRSIEDVSKNLVEIAELAGRSVSNALEGAKAVSEVMEGITLISGSSEQIGGIITVISDIADQTNLLALNAAIEAARAGEHGRGFAVVADEVSKLADRSSTSTKEIEGLIKESVKNVTRGVETARGSQAAMEQIRAASRKVQEMIEGLSASMSRQVAAVKELTGSLGNVSEMSRSISAATEEQTTNARQVSQAVENVNEVTQDAASSAEEMSAATEQLAHLAEELSRMVSQFKITSSP